MSAPMMTPNLNNGGRWHHIASEAEITRAMRDKGNEIIEVPAIGITFVVNMARLTCIRTSIMGGDTFEIQGGWVYANDLVMRFDREEWRDLERGTRGMNA